MCANIINKVTSSVISQDLMFPDVAQNKAGSVFEKKRTTRWTLTYCYDCSKEMIIRKQ